MTQNRSKNVNNAQYYNEICVFIVCIIFRNSSVDYKTIQTPNRTGNFIHY